MPQDSLTYTKLGIPDSTPPESALSEINHVSSTFASRGNTYMVEQQTRVARCVMRSRQSATQAHPVKQEEAMIGKTFWTTVAIMLVCCAATAADIRRVVTALGSDDKAIALFDTRMALDA